VHGFKDADFDMDIDPNFHESESLFYNALDHLKQEEGDSAEEEKEEKEEKKAEKKEANEEEKEAAETKKKKPVKFL